MSTRKWGVAASIAAVEALKDQGIARWNYPIRCLHQHFKNNIRSYSLPKKISAPSSVAVSNKFRDQKLNKSEESLRTVMFLSCWGPN
ncbi:uncharacterized protein LOC130807294 [Amaranthus tricolor]|uniref:uncharacterized protein LOC130807294 n=1 Tax=Amaranthus tricolor TaxID=29722 RepID=UPI0025893E26|nr:uncharacterized protein LOC130807294 [Amaranthus tricolor]